jgi:hypothetical protein
MIQTPFGDLTYDDATGLQDWMGAHDQRHRAERHAIAILGVSLSAFPLTQMLGDRVSPNSQWFGRHMLMHYALRQFFTPDDTVSSLPLEMEWTDETKFNEWHRMHTQIHSQIDKALGIT